MGIILGIGVSVDIGVGINKRTVKVYGIYFQ